VKRGESQISLAREFNINPNSVSKIVRQQIYKNI